MSLGGQKGSQSQNQTYSGSGTSTSDSSVAGSQRAVAPGGWEDLWRGITSMGGTTPGQTTANDYFAGQLKTPGGTADQVFDYARWFANKANAPGVGGNISAPGVVAGDAAATHGYDLINKYQDPWTQQVVDAATNDLTVQRDRAQNASNMAATAAGGIANARTGLRDAQVQDDFLRTLASTTGGLRSQGFQNAMSGALQDAGLTTQVGVGNADRSFNASSQNAANSLAAQQANARIAFENDQASKGYATSALDAVLQSGGIRDAAAGALANLGGGTFSQLLAGLGAGTPLFGTDTTGTESTKGSTSATGQSSGSGNSSSKGGGVKLF